jgi:pimeloyl-ACP methyl ester carboxylesterase
MRQRQVIANGVRFAYLEKGEGPVVLLLHGFPDNAYTWEHQLPVLARAGYRAVAPWLRGYPPTEIPARGYYDRATLAMDVKCLAETFGAGQPCYLVAQDWGAAIGYGVLGAFPELFTSAMMLAVPHPLQIRRTLRRSPKHVIRSFHWYLFQLPWLPEQILRMGNFAFLDFLWWLWSAETVDDPHIARIKEMMSQPGAVEATLAYYRAIFDRGKRDPALGDLARSLDRPIAVPTRVLCGARDMRGEMLETQRDLFAADYEWGIVDGAGHFLHRERPEEVNREIVAWLAR